MKFNAYQITDRLLRSGSGVAHAGRQREGTGLLLPIRSRVSRAVIEQLLSEAGSVIVSRAEEQNAFHRHQDIALLDEQTQPESWAALIEQDAHDMLASYRRYADWFEVRPDAASAPSAPWRITVASGCWK